MSELSSALFSIADDNEFRFARFYIVCEAVPLGAPESPLIVCGLSDTPRELSKRGKTQNSMSDVARKKYSDFTPKNCRCRLHLELIVFCLLYTSISKFFFYIYNTPADVHAAVYHTVIFYRSRHTDTDSLHIVPGDSLFCPVSYTHLDVYKRQAPVCASASTISTPGITGSPGKCPPK